MAAVINCAVFLLLFCIRLALIDPVLRDYNWEDMIWLPLWIFTDFVYGMVSVFQASTPWLNVLELVLSPILLLYSMDALFRTIMLVLYLWRYRTSRKKAEESLDDFQIDPRDQWATWFLGAFCGLVFLVPLGILATFLIQYKFKLPIEGLLGLAMWVIVFFSAFWIVGVLGRRRGIWVAEVLVDYGVAVVTESRVVGFVKRYVGRR